MNDQPCEASPPEGGDHSGAAAKFVRMCPQGHWRVGHACEGCAGNGAVLCIDCPGRAPAVLVDAITFGTMLVQMEHQLPAGTFGIFDD